MKTLKKLMIGMKADEQRKICLSELIKVMPQRFKKQIEFKGKSLHEIEVEIVSVSQEMVNGNDLLKVIAKAWKDGIGIFVDNPLYYYNAPIMVPDGTFETVMDEFGKEIQVANFIENPEEALRQIVLETIRVTSLADLP